jgi:carbon monoxide dehydrogenase subunit G
MIYADHIFTLPVPPAEAFAYLSNPANDAQWQSSCVSAELLDPVPVVGCRYSIVFSFLGRKMKFTSEITVFEPDRECAFKAVAGSFFYEGRYSLRPHADGTEVHWRFAAEPGSFFGILSTALLRKVLISQVEKDSAVLARLLTGRAAISPT